MRNAETVRARQRKLEREIAAFLRWQHEWDATSHAAGKERTCNGQRRAHSKGSRTVFDFNFAGRLRRRACYYRAARQKRSGKG